MVDAGGDDVECRAHMMFEGSIARKKIVGELGHVLGTRLCAEKDGIAMLEYITPNSNVYMLLAKSTISTLLHIIFTLHYIPDAGTVSIY